ncbi:MAG: glycoside hydrolase family 3 C-terminal domain-containing protein [Clostridium sp.]|nr:glycoside hydrolase family 3 C-terminal domain-containing protein [Clostridium sp.]
MGNYKVEKKDGYTLYENQGGPVLGSASGRIVEQDGYAFKDLAGTGELLPYEDWRLEAKERAKDLASRLSIEDIAGLMMYSPHQMVPAIPGGMFGGTYEGKDYQPGVTEDDALTDQQQAFLSGDRIRHVLAMVYKDAETAAKWNNRVQAFVEKQGFGVPVSIASDPRHSARGSGAEYKSGSTDVSKWPEGLGIAASFDADLCREFGKVIAKEYRALGITTALSPQIDIATEPRWLRFEDTFGSSPELVTAMAKAYCDGLQTTEELGEDASASDIEAKNMTGTVNETAASDAAGAQTNKGTPAFGKLPSKNGWGKDSVAAMAKHWPGGGPCEGGRDAHYPFGKFAVYPGGKFETHMKPFLEGAFALDGPTGTVASIMPYYTVSYGVDTKNGKNVGNSYSRYIINDLLREKYGYDGVVCTDWGITQDPEPVMDSFGSRCYGVEDLTEGERHLLAIENGVDQFGGNCKIEPVLEAYRLGCEKYGESAMRARMERSAARLLLNLFRCGLFENPYLDAEESKSIVGCEAFRKAGYEAQLKSLVLLKNGKEGKAGILPISGRKKVYIPKRFIKAQKNFFRGMDPDREVVEADKENIAPWFDLAETPQEADLGLVFIESPLSDGYSAEDAQAGGNGYLPISLQYRPYRANAARKVSIAGGDFREDFTNRSYAGKTGTAANERDLDLVLETKKAMGDKPVIVCIRMHKPTVLAELEPYADAIVVDFGVQKSAVYDILCGKAEPSGRLPIQLPRDMETVEKHCEDAPLDMDSYVDSEGHVYDFGYGMNWKGVITG